MVWGFLVAGHENSCECVKHNINKLNVRTSAVLVLCTYFPLPPKKIKNCIQVYGEINCDWEFSGSLNTNLTFILPSEAFEVFYQDAVPRPQNPIQFYSFKLKPYTIFISPYNLHFYFFMGVGGE